MADEEKAGLLLVRQLDNFGETTALQLAVTSDNKAFIAHAACQSLLNTIWRGHIAPDISTLKVTPMKLFSHRQVVPQRPCRVLIEQAATNHKYEMQ